MGSSSDSRIRLRPADPFDLIRLIGRTQSDPRKAIAELVQNSLDADAKKVSITWFSDGGRRALAIHDDGVGVFPEMERRSALERIATTIGHSHKRDMSAAERREQMLLGKYGIGLLGFWSVGKTMEIRTRVKAGETWSLKLVEEQRDAEVTKARASKLALEETFTEVTIRDIHPAAEPQLKPRRLAAYLASELRGQLLQRDTIVEIHDRVARGLAQKRLVVRPHRYRGAAIEDLRELPIEGFSPAQVEIYLLPESEAGQNPGRVSLSCGGTVVLDDLATLQVSNDDSVLDSYVGPRAPWSSGRFDGSIDFPDLEVAPATRRGFVPNSASLAFLAALPAIETRLREILEQDAARRAIEAQANDAKDLRKLFKKLTRSLPQYTLFSVPKNERPKPDAANDPIADGAPLEEGDAKSSAVAELPENELDAPAKPASGFLFPPGPLAEVRLKPSRSVVATQSQRILSASAHDADGRRVTDVVEFSFSLHGPGSLEAVAEQPNRAVFSASDHAGESTVTVSATQGMTRVEAKATIVVRDEIDLNLDPTAGVPDPQGVDAPAEPWRSRVLEGVWQYNTGHPDYQLVRDEQRKRLRYLALLFAKEIVLRNFGSPMENPILERMVEIVTHLDIAER